MFTTAHQEELDLINDYLSEELDLDEIAKKIGHPRTDLPKWLKHFGVEGDDGRYVPNPEHLPEDDIEALGEHAVSADDSSSEDEAAPDEVDSIDADSTDAVEPTSKPVDADLADAVDPTDKPACETIMPIDDIARGQRFRKDPGDIEALAKSIAEVGLLHPPVVTSDNKLVCGFRRIEACRSLGMTDIPVRIMDIDDLLRAEVDENILRQSFTVSELVAITEAMREKIETDAHKRKLGTLKNVSKTVDPVNYRNDRTKVYGETNELLAEIVGISATKLKRATEVILARGCILDTGRYSLEVWNYSPLGRNSCHGVTNA